MSFQGKKNIYLCTGCGHGIVSQDLDDAVTPFMIYCDRPGCGKPMQSLCYKAPQQMLQSFPAAIEWYKPSPEETLKLSPQMQEHIQKGGLARRQATA